jgi:hypothetical protein
MCIQRADAVNVMGGGKYLGKRLAGRHAKVDADRAVNASLTAG